MNLSELDAALDIYKKVSSKYCDPSPYGDLVNRETKIDPEVRLGMECPASRIKIETLDRKKNRVTLKGADKLLYDFLTEEQKIPVSLVAVTGRTSYRMFENSDETPKEDRGRVQSTPEFSGDDEPDNEAVAEEEEDDEL
eukprot:gene35775-44113_t